MINQQAEAWSEIWKLLMELGMTMNRGEEYYRSSGLDQAKAYIRGLKKRVTTLEYCLALSKESRLEEKSELNLRLANIEAILEDWDAPIMEAREEISDEERLRRIFQGDPK